MTHCSLSTVRIDDRPERKSPQSLGCNNVVSACFIKHLFASNGLWIEKQALKQIIMRQTLQASLSSTLLRHELQNFGLAAWLESEDRWLERPLENTVHHDVWYSLVTHKLKVSPAPWTQEFGASGPGVGQMTDFCAFSPWYGDSFNETSKSCRYPKYRSCLFTFKVSGSWTRSESKASNHPLFLVNLSIVCYWVSADMYTAQSALFKRHSSDILIIAASWLLGSNTSLNPSLSRIMKLFTSRHLPHEQQLAAAREHASCLPA